MDVIKHRFIYIGIATALVVLAIAVMAGFGFRFGIDMEGGALWQVSVSEVTAESLEAELNAGAGLEDARVTRDERDGTFWVRMPERADSAHRADFVALKSAHSDAREVSFQSIGPSVSGELRSRAIWAIILVLLGISLYIAYAFRGVSRPVSSFTYGWVTLLTLVHDVAIPAGLLAILGRFAAVDLDTNFIVALLVVMGFSVHDTIVVFDRIRENLIRHGSKESFGNIIKESVQQTIARSINTSFTLVLVLVSLWLIGPVSLRYFSLIMLVGVVAGTYSSIFVASPALYLVASREKREK